MKPVYQEKGGVCCGKCKNEWGNWCHQLSHRIDHNGYCEKYERTYSSKQSLRRSKLFEKLEDNNS